MIDFRRVILRRKTGLGSADWQARRRRMARKRSRAQRPADPGRLQYERDRSDAQKRPATAALAFLLNFFFPGAGLIIYGKKQWGIAFMAVTALTLYFLWPITMAFTQGMTANYAFRQED